MKNCFISSTVLDLKDLRDILDSELSKAGFTMMLSEKGTIPADSSLHSYDVCIEAARTCDVLIAIIDGRYGGEVPGTGKSITQVEIDTAFEAGRQVRVFVRQSVWDAKEVLRPYYKKEIKFCPSKIVEDDRVFTVIDALRSREDGNWIFQFNTPNDILRMLAVQFDFELTRSATPEVDLLDRIITRKVLSAFPDGMVIAIARGFQVGAVQADSVNKADEATEDFYPSTMHFAAPQTEGSCPILR